jgi:hypothetical protein
VKNESGGDSVEAHIESAVAAARRKMTVVVECLLPLLNRSTKMLFTAFTLAAGLFITKASRLGRVLYRARLYGSVLWASAQPIL